MPILNTITPHLKKHFPDAKLSLEVSNDLKWTTEKKLLVNIDVSEEMFFNGMLNHMNEIYQQIKSQTRDKFCPIVLFPGIQNKNFEKMDNYSVINLLARTAYFNNDYNNTIEREITLRDIPYEQQKREIIEYCNTHEDIYAPDIEFELQIDYKDIVDILDEIEEEGLIIKEG